MIGRKTLNSKQHANLFDAIGGSLDLVNFIDNRCYKQLLRLCNLQDGCRVLEVGAGRGYFGQLVFDYEHSREAIGKSRTVSKYVATDCSPCHIEHLNNRFRDWKAFSVVESNGGIPAGVRRGTFDLAISAYVLDTMADVKCSDMLDEIHDCLVPNGRCYILSITHGNGPLISIVSKFWNLLHFINPKLTGGSWARSLADEFCESKWSVVMVDQIVSWPFTSELVIAKSKRGYGRPPSTV